MATKRGLFLPEAGEEDPKSGREFLQSPERFAETHGLDPNDLACPEVAHDAFLRATAFANEIDSAAIEPNTRSLQELKGIAGKHFGEDFDVALIPFGLKFREKVSVTQTEITATGTGSVTFLDGDADVDS